ncbi:insulinase family protein [Parabacteroides sp. OttesenSCG-928-N08]|nr:insulinase family protein [Parabacteroides sp. OttesenSCG-928-N08]
MQYTTYELKNGLRLIHLPIDSPVSYCGFGIQAGTRDEENDEFGLAHFVEHMLFKGTEKRRAWHILNRMEYVGGELNAFTTKEDTYLYSIFMEEHFDRAFELLADLVFHSRFPQHELTKEVDVILDEIGSYEDNPSELIFDDFENMLFDGHALGHAILGDEQSLLSFTSETGLSFMQRYYQPSNMICFSMGRMDAKRVFKRAERLLGDLPSSAAEKKRVVPALPHPFEQKMDKETHQSHVMIGGRAYHLHDTKRTALFLLNNLLGGPGMNNRLNLLLREKHGLVYSVESNITSYTDTGVSSIYFGTDPKHRKRAIGLVHRVLKELRENKLSTSQLAAVKRQAIGQLVVASDNRESQFLGLGKSFMHYNRYDYLPEVFARLEKVTAEQLNEIANELYDPSQLFTLIYE